MTESTEI